MKPQFTKLLMGVGAVALMSAGNAYAAGTAAGTDVSNTFQLSYEVGGVTQTYVPDTDDTVTFEVDRTIDLTVAVQTTDPLSATPGQSIEQIFEVTNNGNAPQAYALTLSQAGGTDDDFDIDTGTGFLAEVSTDGGTNWTTYTLGSATDDIAADDSILIRITSVVPVSTDSGDTAEIAIVADTLEPATGGFGTAGTAINTSSASNDPDTVDTVLNDGTGDVGDTGGTDGDGDGNHSDTHTVIVQDATLEGVKDVILISEDGSGCATFPGGGAASTPAATTEFYLPNACVEYTITLTNTGTADADITSLVDVLREELTFVAADTNLGGTLTIPVASTANDVDCDYNGAPNPPTGSENCTITVANGSVPAPTGGATEVERRLRIRALVK